MNGSSLGLRMFATPSIESEGEENQSLLGGGESTVNRFFKETFTPIFKYAPITTLQVTGGFIVYVFGTIGLLPRHKLLFHPSLAFSPLWQTHRALTGFLVLGNSAYELVQRTVGLIMWQVPLERAFTSNISIPDSPPLSNASTKELIIQKINHLKSSLRQNTFIQAQTISAITILSLDLLFHSPPSQNAIYLSIFPYSLYTSLEYSMRWLWAATETAQGIPVFGLPITIPPVYTPLITCAIGGFTEGYDMCIGLVAAFAVGYALDLRRRDGERVVDWLKSIGLRWGNFLYKHARNVYDRKVLGKKKRLIKGLKENNRKKDDGVSMVPNEWVTAAFSNIVSSSFSTASGMAGPSLSVGDAKLT